MEHIEPKHIYVFGTVTAVLAMYGLRELHHSLESKRRVNEFVAKEQMHAAAAESARQMMKNLTEVTKRIGNITQKFVDEDFEDIVDNFKTEE